MTYQKYTQQALCRYNLPRLKRVATELGVTPTDDKRAAQTWVNAIISHQSAQVQKVANEQDLAQAELDNYIADQAQTIAPEPFTIVEISFDHHEYYADDKLGQTHLKYKNPLIARVSAFFNVAYFFIKIHAQQGFQKSRAFALDDKLIASITHDDNHLTQPWVVMVKSLRSNSKFKIQNSKLKTISGGLYSQLINSKLFPFLILNFEFCILNSKKVNDKEVFRANTLMRCDRFICTHYKDGSLPVQEEAGGQGAGSKGEEISPLHPAPCSLSSSTTENQIMAHIFNECQNYGFEVLDDGIYNNNGVKLGQVGCTDGNWWVKRRYSVQQQYSNSVLDAVRSLSMVDVSTDGKSIFDEYFLDQPLEQLTGDRLQRLLERAELVTA